MKKTLLALTALILFGSAFAQARLSLRIACNESNAEVYVDDQLMARTGQNLVLNLPAGVHSVRVSKAGFQDYLNPQVVLRAPDSKTLTVILSLAPVAVPSSVGRNVEGPVPAGKNVVAPVSEGKFGAEPVPAGKFAAEPSQMTESPEPSPQVIAVPSDTVNTYGKTIPLNIDANVRGAQVFVNGQFAGQTPLALNVGRGSYEIRVTAPGYLESIQRANVRAPMNVNMILQVAMSQLSVTSNVTGATVMLNGRTVGQTPFVTTVAAGAYTLVVRAPGYMDYQADLSVNGPQAINAVLQGALAYWQLAVPASASGQRRMQFWVDGVFDGDFSGQLTPGRHVLRLAAGDLVSETQIDVQAGRSYIFEPFLGINVK